MKYLILLIFVLITFCFISCNYSYHKDIEQIFTINIDTISNDSIIDIEFEI